MSDRTASTRAWLGPLSIRSARLLWHRHPGVRSADALTFGERAADRMRNGMGSWVFVICALVFLAGWMIDNRNSGFDPYPFILLNLVLSCLAAMQGAILLIAARRSDQISAELAQHDYDTNTAAAVDIQELRRKIDEVLRRLDNSDPHASGQSDLDVDADPDDAIG